MAFWSHTRIGGGEGGDIFDEPIPVCAILFIYLIYLFYFFGEDHLAHAISTH